jgi:hypothetical protein
MARKLKKDGTFKKNTKEIDDPNTRAEYMQLLELHNQNRIDYNVRKWETIKLGQTIVSAVYVVMIVVILTAARFSLLNVDGVRFFIAVLLLMAAFSCFVTWWNLGRESDLLYLEEGTMFKIAHLLELNIEVEHGRQWLPGDRFLFFKKWRDSYYRMGKQNTPSEAKDEPMDLEQWAEAKTRRHWPARYYGGLFFVFGLVGVLFAVIVFFWGASWDQPKDATAPHERPVIKQVNSFEKLDCQIGRFAIRNEAGEEVGVFVTVSNTQSDTPAVKFFVDEATSRDVFAITTSSATTAPDARSAGEAS